MGPILAGVVALEVVAIAASIHSFSFDDYVTIVIILLAFPLAFFAFQYLRNVHR